MFDNEVIAFRGFALKLKEIFQDHPFYTDKQQQLRLRLSEFSRCTLDYCTQLIVSIQCVKDERMVKMIQSTLLRMNHLRTKLDDYARAAARSDMQALQGILLGALSEWIVTEHQLLLDSDYKDTQKFRSFL
jgi:hypothetical protein